MKTESKVAKDIDDYIAGFPREVQEILQKIRSVIKTAAPDAKEAIKYRIPTFVLGENLVHFAAFSRHVGFYPTASPIKEFKSDLADFKTAKGSIQFPLDRPVPFSLIKRIVEFRVKQARAKNGGKRRRA